MAGVARLGPPAEKEKWGTGPYGPGGGPLYGALRVVSAITVTVWAKARRSQAADRASQGQ